MLISLFSITGFAQQASEQSPADVKAAEPSKAELAIDSINQDIVDLTQSLKTAAGDERDAIQLQLFQKNEDLRSQLAIAVNSKSISEPVLLKQIKQQIQYSQGARSYLDEKIKAINEQINDAKLKINSR
ncbi:hypothetical protein JCM19238_2547 [Vibrio ponticus]|nr:hypothetical protein JCM19238_2547 [Vibrio ponticus]